MNAANLIQWVVLALIKQEQIERFNALSMHNYFL